MSQTNQHLYLCYGDIIAGFSVFRIEDETFYVKHLNVLDLILLEEKVDILKKEGKNKNFQSEEEKLKLLNSSGEWTSEKEKEHQNSKIEIKNLEKSLEKIFIQSQKTSLERDLKKKEKKHLEEAKTRSSLVGHTLDAFLEKRKNEESIRLSLFKDSGFKSLFFEAEEFSEIDDDFFTEIIIKYNKIMEKFSDENIKKVAASGFFLNPFFLSKDDCYSFFGKRIVDLSFFQQNLFSKGILYKSILSQGKNPPDAFYEDVEKLVSWFDSAVENNATKQKGGSKAQTTFNKQKKSRNATGIVGASKEEIQAMSENKGESVINLGKEMEKYRKELGKNSLDMIDIVNLHARLGI